MMNRGENSDSIPIDLILEILSRLPAKSVGRFRCVSKLWGSMLSRSYFTELFLTRSSARPRLLILVRGYGEWLFYSSSQPQNPYEKSNLVVAADFHTKFRRFCSYASGLIYITHDQWISKKAMPVVCNPITGKYAILPELDGMGSKERLYSMLLGFDPINKQFKVLLVINMGYNERVFHILTLGTDKVKWRKIQPLIHYPFGEGICINGVLYYLALHSERLSYMIVCFDVRSEKFKFIDAECFRDHYGNKLISYKGKLGGIAWDCADKNRRKLRMWVLEDVEKQEWSKHVYTLSENEFVDSRCLFIAGVSSTGEIVLAMRNACKPFSVFYFNPQRNTLQHLEIQGVVGDLEWFRNHRVYAVVDHVEDLNFNVMLDNICCNIYKPI